MKKSKFLTIFAIAIISVFSFAFVGCTNKDKDNEPENPQTPAKISTFSYRVENNVAYITGGEIDNIDVVFPESIDDYSVKGIDDNAFRNNSLIKSIKIPNTYSSIGLGTFYNCSNLQKVIQIHF